MQRNTGKNAERGFKAKLLAEDGKAYIERLPDTHDVIGLTKGQAVALAKKPSDFIVVSKGTMYFAEVKDCSNKVSFPFSNIKQSQLTAAKRTRIAGGKYFFFIRNKTTGDWYKVPCEVILDHERKSIKWKELTQYDWT